VARDQGDAAAFDQEVSTPREDEDMAQDIVAVDVGGTFTDICVLPRETGDLRVAKVPSTPNPIDGVMAAVGAAGIDLSEVALFSHGTTVATNALITRDYPVAAMVTTKGFRDVIEIRRGTKEDLWDAYKDVPPPPIRRRHRFEVAERIDYAGNVLEPLDEEGALEVARLLKRHRVETVAVCFINSYAMPQTSSACARSSRRSSTARSSRHRATCFRRSSSTSGSRPRSPTPSCSPWWGVTCATSKASCAPAATRAIW